MPTGGGLIGALRVTLGLDTAQFHSNSKRARAQAKADARAIQAAYTGARNAISGAVSGVVAGLTAGTLLALTKRALDYAGGLGEIAQQLGTTTKELQTFRFVAGQVGVTQEEADKALQKFRVTMGQVAVGAEAPTRALEGLQKGLSNAVQGKAQGEQLRLVADAISKVGDSSKRAAVEAAIFGSKLGPKLDPLLTQGRKGIDELATAAERLGVVLSDEQIQRADETADKLAALQTVLEARIAGVVADNADSILQLATSLANLAAGLARFWSQDPSRALGIIGALGGGMVGGRIAGLPGAAIGAISGYLAGSAAAPDTAASLRKQADAFKMNASQIARSRGFFKPGTTQAEKDRIVQDVGVQANLRQYRRLMAEAAKLQASGSVGAPPSAPALGGGDVGDFLADTGGGRKGKDLAAEAERKRKEALRDAFERERALSDAKAEELSAQRDLLTDYVDRATISHQLIDVETDQHNKQLDLAVALGDLDAAAAEQLKASNERLRILKKQQVNQEVELDRQRDFEAMEQTAFGIERDKLQAEAALAETAAERRRVEMDILDLAYRERKERLERIIAESKDAAEIERARRELASLPSQRRLDERGVVQGTRGPLETYLAGIPRTAEQINERVEGLIVDELEAVRHGINDAIMNAIGVEDPLLAGIIDLFVQEVLIRPIADAMNKARTAQGGGGGFGGFLSSLLGFGAQAVGGMSTSAIQATQPFAAQMILANPGIFDKGGFTGNAPRRKVTGVVHGQEYVFDADATRRIGVPMLEAMQAGRISPGLVVPRFHRPTGRDMPIERFGGRRGGDTNIYLQGPMTKQQARETMTHVASASRQRLGVSARRGLAGPV